MTTAYRICVVCLGNICRSPMAESALRQAFEGAGLATAVEVDSAGMGDWHVGKNADPRALATLTARGYSIDHSPRQFQAEWFSDKDLVIALDNGNLHALRALAPTPEAAQKVRLMRSFDPAAGDDLEVPDPYHGSPADFERALDLIERAVPGVVEHVRHALRADGVSAAYRTTV